MTPWVWVAIGLAAVIFCIFAGWPLYQTYRTRGMGADVDEARAYFKAKEEYEHSQPATGEGGQRTGGRDGR